MNNVFYALFIFVLFGVGGGLALVMGVIGLRRYNMSLSYGAASGTISWEQYDLMKFQDYFLLNAMEYGSIIGALFGAIFMIIYIYKNKE